MEEKKGLPVLHVVAALLLLTAIAALVYNIIVSEFGVLDCLAAVSLCVTAAYAIFYLITGCRKHESSSYFKVFLLCFAFSAIFGLLAMLGAAELALYVKVEMGAELVCLLILLLVKNIGRQNSLVLGGIVCAMVLFRFVASLVNPGGAGLDFRAYAELLLALVMLLLLAAKYQDKASRGSN